MLVGNGVINCDNWDKIFCYCHLSILIAVYLDHLPLRDGYTEVALDGSGPGFQPANDNETGKYPVHAESIRTKP